MNLASLRRDLKHIQTQRNDDTSTLTQWRCEILIKICENIENSNDVNLNTVFWHIESSNDEVFNMCDMPTDTIYKIIAPDLEYWYMECRPIMFAGVQKRPDGRSNDRLNQPIRPYYHSVRECAINDLPCSKWKSCSGPCDEPDIDDDLDSIIETELISDELRSSIFNGRRMAIKRPHPTPIGSPPEMLPDEFDEMPTLMYNDELLE